MRKIIPRELYEQVLKHTVVSAVDAVIHRDGEVLVALRKQDPCKGQWWIPGGRQEKGESGEEAIVRKVKEEVGLDVKVERLIGVYDISFGRTAFQNVRTGVHHVVRVYLVTPKNAKQNVRTDSTQKEYKWIGRIEEGLHNYVKRALSESGVFEKK